MEPGRGEGLTQEAKLGGGCPLGQFVSGTTEWEEAWTWQLSLSQVLRVALDFRCAGAKTRNAGYDRRSSRTGDERLSSKTGQQLVHASPLIPMKARIREAMSVRSGPSARSGAETAKKSRRRGPRLLSGSDFR